MSFVKSGLKFILNVSPPLNDEWSGLFNTVPDNPLASAIPFIYKSQLFFLHIILSLAQGILP